MYATSGIMEHIEKNPSLQQEVDLALVLYSWKQWGNLCDEDKQMNDDAIESGQDRILARYNLSFGDIYIITEWNRSMTTIMLCDEY